MYQSLHLHTLSTHAGLFTMKREILNGYLVLFCILAGKSDAVDEGNNKINCFPRFVNVLNLDTRNHRYKKRFSIFVFHKGIYGTMYKTKHSV